MLTKTDLKLIRLLMKEMLDETESRMNHKFEGLRQEMRDFKKEIRNDMAEFKLEVRTQLKQIREDVIVFKDEILGEISKVRDDMTVFSGWRDMMEDHEQRITKLEKKPAN